MFTYVNVGASTFGRCYSAYKRTETLTMVQGIERDADDRLDDIERTLNGEAGEKGLVDRVDTFASFIVYADPRIKDHEQRLAILERRTPPPRNWLKVPDVDTAQQWLAELDEFATGTLDLIAPVRLTPCWLWHPRVVVELLALQAHVEGVYKSGAPAALSDLLARHLDMYGTRIESKLGECRTASRHVAEYPDEDRNEWKVDEDAADAYVSWWCTTPDRRERPPGLMPA